MNKQEREILEYVLKELINRDLVDKEAFDQTFGAKSFDEIAEGMKKYLYPAEGQ